MKALKFEKKSEPIDNWDKNGIEIKFCPDYKKRFFSKECKLQDQCKNAKKIFLSHINKNGEDIVNSYPIKCDGRFFICNHCKKEFTAWDKATTCLHNYKVKLERKIKPGRMDYLEKGVHIGKPKGIK